MSDIGCHIKVRYLTCVKCTSRVGCDVQPTISMKPFMYSGFFLMLMYVLVST